MAQPLRLCQIGFAAAQGLLRLCAFNRDARQMSEPFDHAACQQRAVDLDRAVDVAALTRYAKAFANGALELAQQSV